MNDKAAPESKADSTNPKDLLGVKKVSISKIPAVAIVHGAHAMMDGARKYGAYNWRAKKVVAGIYVDAAMRHIMAWFEGEEVAQDSAVHHLGHAIACCAILLDAQETGNLVDDRPVTDENRAVLTRVLDRLNKQISARAYDVPAPKSEVPISSDKVTVTVNSRPYTTRRSLLSYDDVVQIAYGLSGRGRTDYSVTTYVPGCQSKILNPGDSVMVENGMVINAMLTGSA